MLKITLDGNTAEWCLIQNHDIAVITLTLFKLYKLLPCSLPIQRNQLSVINLQHLLSGRRKIKSSDSLFWFKLRREYNPSEASFSWKHDWDRRQILDLNLMRRDSVGFQSNLSPQCSGCVQRSVRWRWERGAAVCAQTPTCWRASPECTVAK